ncbi:MAG: coproporphyrinogen-III oxidase family protein, partial [Verrucomicrobiota bacterium]
AAPSGEQVNRYVAALVRELELVAPRCRPETIFFGGGTPSLLNLRQWETILGAMHRLGLGGAAERTAEEKPATPSPQKVRLLREAGVNRVSMGVQSLDAGLLERLGRVHSREMVFRSFDTLRAAGFDNLNLDLIFAVPCQTREIWHRTLDEALALGSEHLSCYEVIYEEDTPLYRQLQAGEFDIDEDLACTLYEDLVERAGAAGFRQYEVANFGRDTTPGAEFPGGACRHNIGYWRGVDCFGLGPSASEYVDGIRSRNWAHTTRYCEQLEQGRRAVEYAETLSPPARAGELAAFGLRVAAGWPFDEFLRRTGHDLRDDWAGDMQEMVRRGWGEILPDRFR